MSAKEINKLQIISRVAEGKMPRFDAQNLLQVSERTLIDQGNAWLSRITFQQARTELLRTDSTEVDLE